MKVAAYLFAKHVIPLCLMLIWQKVTDDALEMSNPHNTKIGRGQLKCDGDTRRNLISPFGETDESI